MIHSKRFGRLPKNTEAPSGRKQRQRPAGTYGAGPISAPRADVEDPSGRFTEMKLRQALLAFVAGTALLAGTAYAAETISIVAGATGRDLEVLQQELKDFEAKTGNHVNIVTMPSSTSDQFGQYKLWLAAQNTDIDVYRTDVIWAPQLA